MLKKNPLGTAIFCVVLAVHLICITCSRFSIRTAPPARAPLAIRTHRLPLPSPSVHTSPPKKAPKPIYAQRQKKSPPPSTPKKKKKTSSPSLREVSQALAKIHPLPSKIERQAALDVPQAVTALQIDQPTREKEEALTTEEVLIAYLRRLLTLPEYGTVTLEMTITRGKLTRMTVLDAENVANATYLQHHLPLLSFPIQEEGSQTWTLTFCNDT